jgi:hypothetical protein
MIKAIALVVVMFVVFSALNHERSHSTVNQTFTATIAQLD